MLDKIDSKTGYVLFYDTFNMVREAVAPFFPLNDPMIKFGENFDVKKLKLMANKDAGVCVVIVHAGESFVGFAPDTELFSHHRIVRSSVKAKHTKGGWSQRRFERLRDEDIRHHIEKVRNSLELMLEDSGRAIDYIIASGETKLVSEIIKDLDYQVIERQFDVSVDKSNISRILKEVWSSRRYEI